MQDNKKWMTLRQVCKEIGDAAPVDVRTLRRWCETGLIPGDTCFRRPNLHRGHWYIDRDRLSDVLLKIGVRR